MCVYVYVCVYARSEIDFSWGVQTGTDEKVGNENEDEEFKLTDDRGNNMSGERLKMINKQAFLAMSNVLEPCFKTLKYGEMYFYSDDRTESICLHIYTYSPGILRISTSSNNRGRMQCIDRLPRAKNSAGMIEISFMEKELFKVCKWLAETLFKPFKSPTEFKFGTDVGYHNQYRFNNCYLWTELGREYYQRDTRAVRLAKSHETGAHCV